jgi:hypothetical protein
MDECKPMDTSMITNLKKVIALDSKFMDFTLYRQLIRYLIYLVNTRPNKCFAVNALILFMVEPRYEHWAIAKHVLRYLRGTVEYGLRYLEMVKLRCRVIWF